ncbi:MAG: hypothetical protein V1903_07480 [Bacteroidota bacterium]
MMRILKIFALLILLSSCEKSFDEDTYFLKIYGDALEDFGYSVARSGEEYYIAGQFTEIVRSTANVIDVEKASKKMAVIKTDNDGNVIWKKSFGGRLTAAGSKVLALEDGSVVATGFVVDSITKQKDIFVVKISSDGASAVQKIFNSTGTSESGNSEDGNQTGIDIIRSSDGFMLLASTDVARLLPTDSTGNIKGNSDIYLLRLDTDLQPLSGPVVFGYLGNDAGAAIKEAIDGGYIIAGTTSRSEPGQSGNNILLMKVRNDGIATQVRILGTSVDEYAADIEVLDDGYLIAGTVGADGSDQQVYVTKVPESIQGDQLFTRTFRLTTSSSASSFAVRAISRYKNNYFVMAGQAGTGASAKMLVFVADPEGNHVPGKELITTSSGTQVAYDVITDEDDNIVAVGKNTFENNSMISFYKFRF